MESGALGIGSQGDGRAVAVAGVELDLVDVRLVEEGRVLERRGTGHLDVIPGIRASLDRVGDELGACPDVEVVIAVGRGAIEVERGRFVHRLRDEIVAGTAHHRADAGRLGVRAKGCVVVDSVGVLDDLDALDMGQKAVVGKVGRGAVDEERVDAAATDDRVVAHHRGSRDAEEVAGSSPRTVEHHVAGVGGCLGDGVAACTADQRVDTCRLGVPGEGDRGVRPDAEGLEAVQRREGVVELHRLIDDEGVTAGTSGDEAVGDIVVELVLGGDQHVVIAAADIDSEVEGVVRGLDDPVRATTAVDIGESCRLGVGAERHARGGSQIELIHARLVGKGRVVERGGVQDRHLIPDRTVIAAVRATEDRVGGKLRARLDPKFIAGRIVAGCRRDIDVKAACHVTGLDDLRVARRCGDDRGDPGGVGVGAESDVAVSDVAVEGQHLDTRLVGKGRVVDHVRVVVVGDRDRVGSGATDDRIRRELAAAVNREGISRPLAEVEVL